MILYKCYKIRTFKYAIVINRKGSGYHVQAGMEGILNSYLCFLSRRNTAFTNRKNATAKRIFVTISNIYEVLGVGGKARVTQALVISYNEAPGFNFYKCYIIPGMCYIIHTSVLQATKKARVKTPALLFHFHDLPVNVFAGLVRIRILKIFSQVG